jgi:dipeptide/tripeptide permease
MQAGTAFPAESGYTAAFAMSAVGLALAFVAALAVPRARRAALVPA